MPITAPGIGSGLDVNGIISQLMAIERRPIDALDKRKSQLEGQISAFGRIRSALDALATAAKALATPSKFSVFSATVADTSLAGASAGSTAVAGSYSLQVDQLAQSHKLASAGISNTDLSLGPGTITIDFGTYDSGTNTFTANPAKTPQTITIAAGAHSLSDARAAINAANAGVSATIINDGTASRLVLTATDGGAANSLRVSVAEDAGGTNNGDNLDAIGLSALAYDPTVAAGSGKNLTEVAAAQDARFVLDGTTITSSSNSVTGALEGVTLVLLKASATPTTLSVSRDDATVKARVEAFVKAYNDFDALARSLSAADPASGTSSALTGDGSLRSMQTRLRAVLGAQVSGASGGLEFLYQAGVSFQRDGSLALDSSVLDAALADPARDVGHLFAASGAATGIAAQVDTLVSGFLDTQGLIASRTDGLQSSIAILDRRSEAMQFRLDAIEARYRAQFTALDKLISSMNQTSTFLTQQLSSLPNTTKG
ncbi:MAG: flagellar filament capping protein FliD [Rhodocyclaceae bacterium]